MKEFKMTMIEAPSPGGVGACEQATVADWMAEEKRRERIATAALQGLLASDAVGEVERFARAAVKFADALIRELDKPKEDKT